MIWHDLILLVLGAVGYRIGLAVLGFRVLSQNDYEELIYDLRMRIRQQILHEMHDDERKEGIRH